MLTPAILAVVLVAQPIDTRTPEEVTARGRNWGLGQFYTGEETGVQALRGPHRAESLGS
jgi:hypothetical protein